MSSNAWQAAERASETTLSVALCYTIALLENSTERISPPVLLALIEQKISAYEALQRTSFEAGFFDMPPRHVVPLDEVRV